jgi:hypothetical protein
MWAKSLLTRGNSGPWSQHEHKETERHRLARPRSFFLLAGIVVALALVGVASATAVGYFNGNVSPGVIERTPDQVTRNYNKACRNFSSNTGIAEVWYYNGSVKISDSGPQPTLCPGQVVSLNNSGNYISKCANEGTATWWLYCETTKP